ncbi:hypothetical protein ACA910_001336 [Epithemia clementina (nom. ined.)]
MSKRSVYEARSLRLDGHRSPTEDPLLIEPLMLESGCSNHHVPFHHHDCLDSQQENAQHPQESRQEYKGQPFLVHRYRHDNRTRILDRDAPFNQSRGRWKVQHVSRDVARHHILPTGNRRRLALTKQLWNDWFYSLAYQRTAVLMAILFMVYTLIVFAFAFIYFGVSTLGKHERVNPDGTRSKLPFCDMDINDHMEALYFSLSTMTSIGYGVSDYYFGGCWTPFFLVLGQACSAITFDAVAIGLLFHRISRGHKRGKTIVFSDTAVVQRVNGILMMFRLGELRRHQLRDASVRAYCIRHERHMTHEQAHLSATGTEAQQSTKTATSPKIETTHYVTRSMKLLHEVVGSQVLMSLPQVIVHRVDSHSPLHLPLTWYDAAGVQRGRSETATSNAWNRTTHTPGEQQRIQFANERANTEAFLSDRHAEIVVLVEGTDELTGATIQSRHSYTPQDLAWDHSFVPCIFPTNNFDEDTEEGSGQQRNQGSRSERFRSRWQQRQIQAGQRRGAPSCIVDFAAFHSTRPTSYNVDSSPYVFC